MRVVVDNNLPYSLARRLSQAGLTAIHVLDLGMASVADHVLRERLAGEAIVFLSRDDDFWLEHPPQWAIVDSGTGGQRNRGSVLEP